MAKADINPIIEPSMQAALEGSRSAAQTFYEAIYQGPLFVPERFQRIPLSDAPQYPSDFFNFLGIQDQGRAVVPAFSSPDLIKVWCGNDLSFRVCSGRELFAGLPEEWWLVINPGQEIEKEFSPWEIKALKCGPEGIAEVLDDLFQPEIQETLDLRAAREDEYPELRKALLKYAGAIAEISKLYLMREEGRDADEQEVAAVLVGVEADSGDPARLEAIREEIRSVAGPHQIGSDAVKVYVGRSVSESMALSIFQDCAPFYSR